MAHGRQTLRDYVYTTLYTAGTGAGLNVTKSRVYPHLDANLPSIVVYTTEEVVLEEGETIGKRILRELDVVAEVRVKALTNYDATIDTICAEIEAAIMADPTLGSRVRSIALAETSIEMSGEEEKPVALATMTFKAVYATLSDDPTQLAS